MDVEGPAGDMKELVRRIQSTMKDFIDDTDTDVVPPLGRTGGFKVTY